MPVHPSFPAVSAPLADELVPGPAHDDPAGAEPAPANRAARRGRAKGHADQGAGRTGSPVRPRAAQGRRVNPVRRTG
jgi:hypothetical protein